MPRRAFLDDLQAASAVSLPDGFSRLAQADEDGSFLITYHGPGAKSSPIVFQFTVAIDDYPTAHNIFVFITSDGAPANIQHAVTDFSAFEGLSISQAVLKLAKLLRIATAGSSENPLVLDSASETEEEEDPVGLEDGWQEDFDEDEDFYDSVFDDLPAAKSGALSEPSNMGYSPQLISRVDARIRSDLRQLKRAGFYVSCHSTPFRGNRAFHLTVACRISKLGISEDAMHAWGLSASKYFLLAIQYTNGYRSLGQIQEEHSSGHRGRASIQIRTAVCARRKATRSDVIDLFRSAQLTQPSQPSPLDEQAKEAKAEHSGALERYFIDHPLNEILNGRFFHIIHTREAYKLNWAGAEQFFQDHQARAAGSVSCDPVYWTLKDPDWAVGTSLPIGDHFGTNGRDGSFPLVAMEYALCHLVRCTDYCLVCHMKLADGFDALKPYVCSKPLCLYQYMALGFGPSIEHEISAQPYVVDLLISFCYARAHSGKLADGPGGMGLDLPGPRFYGAIDNTRLSPAVPTSGFMASIHPNYTKPSVSASPVSDVSHKSFRALYDGCKEELTLDEGQDISLRPGEWLGIRCTIFDSKSQKRKETIVFRRVTTSEYSPLVVLAAPHATGKEPPELVVREVLQPKNAQLDGQTTEAEVFPFSHKFDDLSAELQRLSLMLFLHLLPSVQEMKQALHQSRNKPLPQLFPDVPPASFSLLRWIIASNRSCIVALDEPNSQSVNTEDRVKGMSGFLQFRFAQGAPDKERKFVDAVKASQGRTRRNHSTIWAWHGSPLHNWHSIIREGLHFKEVAHGRAYGNGVYHSMSCSTSMAYVGTHHSSSGFKFVAGLPQAWQQSCLVAREALSLNEIVNDVPSFVSSNPHMVVQHVDWIQTRYLFVKCTLPQEKQDCIIDAKSNWKGREILPQDPQWTPRGADGSIVELPISAISASRRTNMTGSLSPTHLRKKLKMVAFDDDSILSGGSYDDAQSDATDEEDAVLWTEPSASLQSTQAGSAIGRMGTKRSNDGTDFIPNTLDLDKLPQLPPPPFATPSASKALSNQIKSLQRAQNATPLAELGWYLCEEALDNIYQWIVELHSFDQDLPLARDLKSKNLRSVVLELRFGPQFPFSPPFVRVIRPRFLDFRSGGGGHVTAGGAMCMELLTNDGWSAVSSLESVLLQVRMAISSQDPTPARLPRGPVGEYSGPEAVEAYRRACQAHGWTIPSDFAAIATQQY